jgi:hypothetical protein
VIDDVMVCNLCGRILPSGISKCHNCFHDVNDKVNIIVDERDDIDLRKYVSVRWFCNKCNSKGTHWVRRTKNGLDKCPNCGQERNSYIKESRFCCTRIENKGDIVEDSMWRKDVRKKLPRTIARKLYRTAPLPPRLKKSFLEEVFDTPERG